jgi:hypothetical protein
MIGATAGVFADAPAEFAKRQHQHPVELAQRLQVGRKCLQRVTQFREQARMLRGLALMRVVTALADVIRPRVGMPPAMSFATSFRSVARRAAG